MLLRMQSKVSQHPRNQESGGRSLHKRKSTGINLKMNQMLKLTDKDLKAVTVTLPMFSLHLTCFQHMKISAET